MTVQRRGGQIVHSPRSPIEVQAQPMNENYEAYPYRQTAIQAMTGGAGLGFTAVGYGVSIHRPWRTIGYWSAGIGLVTLASWGIQLIMGGMMASVNPTPLPNNVPDAVRAGHAIARLGGPVAGNTYRGVAVGFDRGIRAEYEPVFVRRTSYYRTPRSPWEATQ